MFIMKVFYQIVQSLKNFIVEIGEMSYFSIRFLKEFYKKPYEFQEFLKQCYSIGNRSLFLVSVTGFIIGLVFTLQTRPTLMEFGAVSWMPSMVSISIIRENRANYYWADLCRKNRLWNRCRNRFYARNRTNRRYGSFGNQSF